MLTNNSDQPTQRIPLGGIEMEMTLANPALAWQQMNYEEKARFLLVAVRMVGKKPLPDPHWQNLVINGLAGVVDGSLILSPIGVFLLQHVIVAELAWVAEWL